MRTRILHITLMLSLCLMVGGCGRVITEASGAVMGASGTFMPIVPISTDQEVRSLGAYARFELGPVTDDIGGKTPVDFLGYLEREFAEKVKDARLPNEVSGNTLVIRGKIVYYESASTVGHVLGPLEQVICRAELVDKQTGKVLAVANCVGRTEASNNAGVRSKASGLAKAFVRWIESRFPESMKTPKQ